MICIIFSAFIGCGIVAAVLIIVLTIYFGAEFEKHPPKWGITSLIVLTLLGGASCGAYHSNEAKCLSHNPLPTNSALDHLN